MANDDDDDKDDDNDWDDDDEKDLDGDERPPVERAFAEGPLKPCARGSPARSATRANAAR